MKAKETRKVLKIELPLTMDEGDSFEFEDLTCFYKMKKPKTLWQKIKELFL